MLPAIAILFLLGAWGQFWQPRGGFHGSYQSGGWVPFPLPSSTHGIACPVLSWRALLAPGAGELAGSLAGWLTALSCPFESRPVRTQMLDFRVAAVRGGGQDSMAVPYFFVVVDGRPVN